MKLERLKKIKALTDKSFTFIKGDETSSQAFALFFCESLQRYYFCVGKNGGVQTEILKDLDKTLFRRTKKRDERALSNYAFKVIDCQSA
jgi:hypothetical protein